MSERRVLRGATAAVLLAVLAGGAARAATPPPSEAQIIAAYEYLLARALVAQRQHDELERGMEWNRLVHDPVPSPREPDVLTSDAWLAVGEASCTILTLPPVGERYLTAQLIDGWGETLRNINPRTDPYHPSGAFAFCLKGARVALPRGTERITLPDRRARLRIRIATGADADFARALQQQITLAPTGTPMPPESVCLPPFTYAPLPGLEVFDAAAALLRDAPPDRHAARDQAQAAVRAVTAAVANPLQRARVDAVIQRQAMPRVQAERLRVGAQENGWVRWLPRRGEAVSPLTRSVLVLDHPWASDASEMIELSTDVVAPPSAGALAITFPAAAEPGSRSHGPWSLTVVDAAGAPIGASPRQLSRDSTLQPNPTGALTLVLAPQLPDGVPAANWLPVPEQPYRLVFRFYAPGPLLAAGDWFPPALHAY